ncbi:MAG: class IV adenylate cyclase [Candidatus Altiarchaeales archaeon HGW-Altiarchaeales-3]|nr:MAG: class IV adenylate cyclase [Candidatus Altiarchaeales archaeon HGW-Altiarchaeales-3]
MLEVEIKARIADVSKLDEIRNKLKSLNAKFIKTEIQEDIYFAHPTRDFGKTDEAIRVRKIDNDYFLTYKGPRIDKETKTREEIEILVEKDITKILKKLCFAEWRCVKKTRETYKLDGLTICLDDVFGIGNFIEIESGDYGDKEKIFEMLGKLGVDREECIREAYTELQGEA